MVGLRLHSTAAGAAALASWPMGWVACCLLHRTVCGEPVSVGAPLPRGGGRARGPQRRRVRLERSIHPSPLPSRGKQRCGDLQRPPSNNQESDRQSPKSPRQHPPRTLRHRLGTKDRRRMARFAVATDQLCVRQRSSAQAMLTHWQARDAEDQYFGLGDKTGHSTSPAAACAHGSSTRSATTARPVTRFTSTGRSSLGRRADTAHLWHLLRYAGRMHLRLRAGYTNLSRLLSLDRDCRRRPRLLRVGRA